MTEDELSRGRWQGDINARLAAIERTTAKMDTSVDELRRDADALKSRMGIVWSALAAIVLAVFSAIFKLWSAGVLGA